MSVSLDTFTSTVQRYERARQYLSEVGCWQDICTQLADSEKFSGSYALAERTFGQAIAFLAAAASAPDEEFRPGVLVDEAWHKFLEFPEAYKATCEILGVPFIYHVPFPEGTIVTEAEGRKAMARATAALVRHGLSVDTALWVAAAQCCCSCGIPKKTDGDDDDG